MPIIKSAKKRVKVAKRATVRNVKTRRTFRDAIKSFYTKPAAKSLAEAQSELDTAVKKGILHKNTAARKKKQLAQEAKKASVKQTSSAKSATKKAPAKKTTAKKTATNKTTTKKSTSKKTVSTKATAKK